MIEFVVIAVIGVKSQNHVACYTTEDCGGGVPVNSSEDACCDHRIDPHGLSYMTPDAEGCNACPKGKS